MKEGWEIKDLGSVCQVQRGLTYSGKDTVDNSNQVVLRATNIDLSTGKLIFDELKYLREDIEIKPIYSLKKDSLLICFSSGSKSHLGKIALVDDDYPNFYFGGFIGQINPSDKVKSKYLFYCLSSEAYKDYISNLTDGVNINNLKAADLKAFPIPLPSLPEQQQIVSILDRSFAAIDQAKANAEKNLQNAKELFESNLQGVFESKVHGNKYDSLNDLCELIVDCEHKTAPTQETGYPSIRTPNIGKGELILENVNRVSHDTYIKWTRRAIPKAGDLILAREAPAGNIAVIPENIEVCLGQRTVLIRPKKEKFIPKYLAYLILSRDVQKILLSHSTGATVQHINMRDIRAFKIFNLSNLDEQQAIVHQLDALGAETQKLEAAYQKKIAALDELKKSILQKAFQGELETETLETA